MVLHVLVSVSLSMHVHTSLMALAVAGEGQILEGIEHVVHCFKTFRPQQGLPRLYKTEHAHCIASCQFLPVHCSLFPACTGASVRHDTSAMLANYRLIYILYEL